MTSTFAQHIAAIPFEPTTGQATGVLAPIMRATGHILYCLGAIAEPGYVLTTEEAVDELKHAAAHLAETPVQTADLPISAIAKIYVTEFCGAVNAAADEYAGWTGGSRGPNLKDLSNRAAAVGSFFDKEALGSWDSNPGHTL